MNKRIKALAKQHGYLRWDQDSQSYELNGDIEEMYSFAELIIRECGQVSLQSSHRDDDMGAIIARNIKDHFGVEE